MVFVKYNQKLKERYDRKNVIDPICLDNIDESNEWFTGISEEGVVNAEDELVFGEEDGLTWGNVASASGVNEPRQHTRRSTSSSSKTILVDESDNDLVIEDDVVDLQSDGAEENLDDIDSD